MHDPSQGEIPASELFLELASELRCSILISVSRNPSKLSYLARELDSTVQDIHRNVNRLMVAGLVRREDGKIHLTEYGRLVTKQIAYFIFMKKHEKFFRSHTLGDIPEKFLQRVGGFAKVRICAQRGCGYGEVEEAGIWYKKAAEVNGLSGLG